MADVSGTWLGTYWQHELPTRFEATLVQGGSPLTGYILDDGRLGEARVIGEVIGFRIQFTKRYLLTSLDPVHYTGTISEDETVMQGTWSIAGFDSGTWEAHRSGENLIADLKAQRPEQAIAKR